MKSLSFWVQNIQVTHGIKDIGIATYITTRVEVTAGGERVDKALACFSSLVLVPVKILPLPVEVLPCMAWRTMAMSPATSEEGSRIERKKERD